jgi:hypothetical protein
VALVQTAPHEVEGNLVFVEHGLSPYWTIGRLLHREFDGYSGEVEVTVDGEEWQVELTYQQGGIAPRPDDPLEADRLYEYRINASGRDRRKVSFLVQPRFESMEHHETGESISTPFDRDGPDEGVNVSFSGSNIEPDDYLGLLWEFVQALAGEADTRISSSYFVAPHDWSNLTTYERYVRVQRSTAKKYIRNDGVMRRIADLCSDQKGAKFEYKVDNQDVVGYNHRLVLSSQDAGRLAPTHSLGKQLKHYHPKHARKEDDEDPLYHPKIGCLVKKSLNQSAFAWDERHAVREEIDEALLNTLRWSGISVSPSGTTFVPDDHFDARETDADPTLYDDPTPEIEAEQEALVVTALREMTDADLDVIERLVSEGEGQHYQEVADGAGRAVSTLYRCLDRMRGIVDSDGGELRFGSRKIAQEIQALVESTEHHLRSAADRAAQLVTMDQRRAESSAFQRWLNEYAVEVMQSKSEGRVRVRIDTVLSDLKSDHYPTVTEALREGYSAWVRDGHDAAEFMDVLVQWSNRGASKTSKVRAILGSA